MSHILPLLHSERVAGTATELLRSSLLRLFPAWPGRILFHKNRGAKTVTLLTCKLFYYENFLAHIKRIV